MKQPLLSDIKTVELIALFARICVAQDDALLGGEVAKFNRLFDRMMDVSNELEKKGQRQAFRSRIAF